MEPEALVAYLNPAVAALCFAAAAVPPVAAAQPDGDQAAQVIEGRWINPEASVIILVGPCGERLCGTVQWASDQAKEDARKGTDQLVGAQLLTDVRQVRENRWQGRLFVPDVNRTVHAKIKLVGPDQLKVSGCAIGRSLCRSQTWNRQDVGSAIP